MSKAPLCMALGEWVSALDASNAPEPVRRTAKRCILDTFGVMIAGATWPQAKVAQEHAIRQYNAGRSRLIGRHQQLSISGAAFANTVTARCLDFDDTAYSGSADASSIHASGIILPVVLAALDEVGGSGRDLMSGFIAGSEAAYFLCRAASPELYRRGWFTTSLIGEIAAAAAAARALHLDAKATSAAIGLAASRSAGTRVCLGFDTTAYASAKAAEGGVAAALMAAEGWRSAPQTFEAADGFFALYNADQRAETAIPGDNYGLSERYLWFKLYPTCSAAQCIGELCVQIAANNDLQPERIASVRVRVPALVLALLRFGIPASAAQAQFSLPYVVACCLTRQRFAASELEPKALADSALKRLAGLVTSEVTGDAKSANEEGAWIEVHLTNGSIIRGYRASATGTPENPMDDGFLERKFAACVEPRLGAAGATALLNKLRNIEALDQIGELALEP